MPNVLTNIHKNFSLIICFLILANIPIALCSEANSYNNSPFSTSQLANSSITSPVYINPTITNFYNTNPILPSESSIFAPTTATKDVESYNTLGTKFLYANKIGDAKGEFNKALKLDHLNGIAKMGLYECDLCSETNPEENDVGIKEKKLKAIIEKNPNDAFPYLCLGDLYYIYGDKVNALNYYNESLKHDPSVDAAYAQSGLIYYTENKIDDAIKMTQKAIDISPLDERYLNNLAYFYYEKQDYQNAIDKYLNILNLNSNILLPYYNLANSYRLIDELVKASHYQEILINKLGDNGIRNNKLNQVEYILLAKPTNHIHLYNFPEKEYYAYYDTALTYYILGNEAYAAEYINKAKNLRIDETLKADVKEILDFDIGMLQEKQPKFISKTIEFRNKFE